MPDPIFVEIGPFSIRWYGLLMASAILIGTILALKQVRKKGIDEEHFMNALLIAIPTGFLGARAYYVIFNWEFYSKNLSEIPAIWHGGIAIHGGILGAFFAAFFVLKHYKIPFLEIADCVAPSLILGQAIGRWGNFFNQEAYGYEVDPNVIPWAMWIDGAYRHPTFLYESLWNLSLFFVLILLRKKFNLLTGELFFTYLGVYSLGRVVVEGFRTDSLMFGPFRVAQLISIVFILISAIVILYRRKHNRMT